MTSKAALFALLALWGIGSTVALPAFAQTPRTEAAGDEEDEGDSARRLLTNRVWVRTGLDDLPGIIRIFLSDGTLVMDSCWETHRLSPWSMISDTALTWNEDGLDIAAEITTLTATQLVLAVSLVGGAAEQQRYEAAGVPSVCPDFPR